MSSIFRNSFFEISTIVLPSYNYKYYLSSKLAFNFHFKIYVKYLLFNYQSPQQKYIFETNFHILLFIKVKVDTHEYSFFFILKI